MSNESVQRFCEKHMRQNKSLKREADGGTRHASNKMPNIEALEHATMH
jgi:hypothetical protein